MDKQQANQLLDQLDPGQLAAVGDLLKEMSILFVALWSTLTDANSDRSHYIAAPATE